MRQKLWTLAFVLAFLKTQLDFCHHEENRDGTLETQGSISTQINLAIPQSSIHGSLECFPHDPVEEPDFHQHCGTVGCLYFLLIAIAKLLSKEIVSNKLPTSVRSFYIPCNLAKTKHHYILKILASLKSVKWLF